MKLHGKRVDLPLLQAEAAAAGVVVDGLGTTGLDAQGSPDELVTWDELGRTTDVPPAMQPVVDAHTAPARYIDYVQTEQFDARIVTTDAQPTEVWRTTLPSQTAYLFTAQVVGVDRGNGTALRFEAKYSVKRLNAGVVQIGTPVVVCDQRDTQATAWSVNPALSGNDVLLRVVGAAGRTIDWIFSANAALYAPAGL